jgi:hypothetical protein
MTAIRHGRFRSTFGNENSDGIILAAEATPMIAHMDLVRNFVTRIVFPQVFHIWQVLTNPPPFGKMTPLG